ncbi:MAG: mannitol dehydrogenase family protein [Rhodobacteraceae bacterium]|nr:mannitol dehydrogenase family protein [Paracoccaceae bacterium]
MTDVKAHEKLIKLSNANLGDLPTFVKRANYDRSKLKAGIVHIGLGNFHRAHQAWYLHRLMQRGEALDWAIVGAGIMEFDKEQRQKLLSQDCLTTLVELDPDGQSVEVIGSMIDYVEISDGNSALIKTMSDADIKIISLTVTEGGYFQDPNSSALDHTHPDIQFDAANAQTPKTVFGAIVEALRLRYIQGRGPVTLQSCDNLQGNGTILRKTLVSLAKMSDPKLAVWIDENCTFPNSMVDCIVPATGQTEIDLVTSLGIKDAVPVTHENFRQWVIEDDFCAGRPEWEKVGVTLSDDVHAFETMKICLLNAGHQILANAGEILGLYTIDECMAHDEIFSLFDTVQREEIAPHVDEVPGMTPEQYVQLISKRFANPKIKDTVRRVAFDGGARHSGFLHPTIRKAIANGCKIEGLALVEALWARMCEGTREDGSVIEPNDPSWTFYQQIAKRAKKAPTLWLDETHAYGDIAKDEAFRDMFTRQLEHIWRDGVEPAIVNYCANSNPWHSASSKVAKG